ncbi:DUF4411 family protein [Xenorhabdus koppenhoeferi]|uniref:DUF4411 family protein n=1 Tax=Xenorhabdus koppenhoeferi TaxID=351659 RepID=UPI0038CDC5DD
MNEGYAPDLTDVDLDKLGKDPFLISYALADPSNRIVVSNEQPSPKKQRANRKIPDVCGYFDVRCCNVYTMIRELDFSTSWKSKV